MLEDVARLSRRTGAKQQSSRLKLVQRGVQRQSLHRKHRGEQVSGKQPANAGANLRNLAHGRSAVEPCHQAVPDRRGNRQFRQRAVKTIRIARLDDLAALDDSLCQLLHE